MALPLQLSEPSCALIAELKGQVMHVPELLDLFTAWPSGGRNKYYGRLKAKMDKIVEMSAQAPSKFAINELETDKPLPSLIQRLP